MAIHRRRIGFFEIIKIHKSPPIAPPLSTACEKSAKNRQLLVNATFLILFLCFYCPRLAKMKRREKLGVCWETAKDINILEITFTLADFLIPYLRVSFCLLAIP